MKNINNSCTNAPPRRLFSQPARGKEQSQVTQRLFPNRTPPPQKQTHTSCQLCHMSRDVKLRKRGEVQTSCEGVALPPPPREPLEKVPSRQMRTAKSADDATEKKKVLLPFCFARCSRKHLKQRLWNSSLWPRFANS